MVNAEEKVVKPLDLKDISQLGYCQKSQEVLKGVTVTYQTLSISCQQQILSHIPADITDPILRFTRLQIETLAYATLAINDKKYSGADVDTLRDFYAGLQGRVLQEFYSVFQQLMDDQETILTSLKKT